MLIILYILAILISMPLVIKKEDWSWMVCFIYLALCGAFTLPVGILIYKYVFHG